MSPEQGRPRPQSEIRPAVDGQRVGSVKGSLGVVCRLGDTVDLTLGRLPTAAHEAMALL